MFIVVAYAGDSCWTINSAKFSSSFLIHLTLERWWLRLEGSFSFYSSSNPNSYRIDKLTSCIMLFVVFLKIRSQFEDYLTQISRNMFEKCRWYFHCFSIIILQLRFLFLALTNSKKSSPPTFSRKTDEFYWNVFFFASTFTLDSSSQISFPYSMNPRKLLTMMMPYCLNLFTQ